jgi:hypothetical protein
MPKGKRTYVTVGWLGECTPNLKPQTFNRVPHLEIFITWGCLRSYKLKETSGILFSRLLFRKTNYVRNRFLMIGIGSIPERHVLTLDDLFRKTNPFNDFYLPLSE